MEPSTTIPKSIAPKRPCNAVEHRGLTLTVTPAYHSQTGFGGLDFDRLNTLYILEFKAVYLHLTLVSLRVIMMLRFYLCRLRCPLSVGGFYNMRSNRLSAAIREKSRSRGCTYMPCRPSRRTALPCVCASHSCCISPFCATVRFSCASVPVSVQQWAVAVGRSSRRDNQLTHQNTALCSPPSAATDSSCRAYMPIPC